MQEAVQLLRQSGAQEDLVQGLRALSQIESELNHTDASRKLNEEAVALCREEADPITLAHTVRHLGDQHRREGRVDAAEACYREAIEIYRGNAGTPPCELANAVRPLAILKQDAAQVEAALELWREAKELYEAASVEEGVAECSDRIAELGQ